MQNRPVIRLSSIGLSALAVMWLALAASLPTLALSNLGWFILQYRRVAIAGFLGGDPNVRPRLVRGAVGRAALLLAGLALTGGGFALAAGLFPWYGAALIILVTPALGTLASYGAWRLHVVDHDRALLFTYLLQPPWLWGVDASIIHLLRRTQPPSA